MSFLHRCCLLMVSNHSHDLIQTVYLRANAVPHRFPALRYVKKPCRRSQGGNKNSQVMFPWLNIFSLASFTYLLFRITETGLSSYWTRKSSELKLTRCVRDYYLACIPSAWCEHSSKHFQSQRLWAIYPCSHTEVPKRTDPHLWLMQADNYLLS